MRVTSVEALLLSTLALSCGGDHQAAAERGDAGSHEDAAAEQTNAMTCDADRPALAYRAVPGADSGEAISATGPSVVPCAQLTGFASSETSLAVLEDGSVLVAPVITVDGTGVLRSKDRARSWETLLPGKLGGAQHDR